MKKYLLILLASLIFGCKKDLSGHWHAKLIDNDNLFNVSIEVFENNDCYLYNSLSYKPIKGEHFPNKNHIFFPGQCGDLSFDYIYFNDKLYLKNALGAKLVAERQNNKCNRFKDFKTLLNIDYLKIEKQREFYKPRDSIGHESLNEYINIDFSKEYNSIRIEYSDKISPLDKIQSIIGSIESSVSNTEIPFINYILTPDKNLKASDLKIVINKLNEGYKKKIFIQTLKVKPEKLNIFEYIKINKIDLNSNDKLFDVIN